ncbi:MAG: polysaccharide deacetylase family protein, partial [Caldimicrobium sp.]
AIVEVHDVNPYYEKNFLKILEFLKTLKIFKCSFLVIPNFWNIFPLQNYEDFTKLLKSLECEIILHGYSHKGQKNLKYLLWTREEGEFADLTLRDTEERIESALNSFKEVGLKSKFFVPPAWIGNKYLESVLKSYGFLGIGYRNKIKNLETGKELLAPTLTFSNRPFLSFLSIKFATFYLSLIQKFSVIRLVLHTKDFRDERKIKLWHFIINKIKRRLTNYEELLCQS